MLGLETAGKPLPRVGPDQVLRWDTRALYGAVNSIRIQRGMTWRQTAEEVGCGVSSLSGIAKASRVGFPGVMRLVRWLGRPAADFTRACSR